MTDAASLTAGRETDKLVAAALGWKDIRLACSDFRFNVVGKPPGSDKDTFVPCYSTTTAALLALEEFSKANAVTVEFYHNAAWQDDELWHAGCRSEEYSAPTLWLAICKAIVATATQVET